MRPAFPMIVASLILVLATVYCSNPVEPDSIWNLNREGESMWFVNRDHIAITDTYHINDYAYITLIDKGPFWSGTTGSVMFVSAIGDTERIQPFILHFHVPMSSEDNFGGASIYLSDLPYALPGDGALEVGTEPGIIKAFYYHEWSRREIQVSATVRP